MPVIPKVKVGARHVVIDATGIKIYGEGKWKTRQHGVSKRRTWRKLHLAVDEATGEILAVEVTRNDKKDGQLLELLFDTIEDDIEQVSADGVYLCPAWGMTSASVTEQFVNTKPKLPSLHARTHVSGSTATVRRRLTPETKTYEPSESTDARSGSVSSIITAAHSLKQRCFALKPVLALKPFLAF